MKTKPAVRLFTLVLLLGVLASGLPPHVAPVGAAHSTTPPFAKEAEPNGQPTTQTLYGVWGSRSDNVLAVGDSGTILRYDGSSWHTMNSGVVNDLYAVWGSGSNNVLAVGEYGIVLRYDGTTWTTMNSGTTQTLYGVWGSASNNVFAVGDGGIILRYNGTVWTTMSSSTAQTLSDVWGSASNNVFAVGNGGTILRYDGANWTTMDSGSTVWLSGVWGSNSNNVLAVGRTGTILRYNGSTWASMSSGTGEWLSAIWGSASDNVFAVGEYGTILRCDGTTWSPTSSGTSSWLYGVWGSGPGNLVIVGGNGTTLVYIQALIDPVTGGALTHTSTSGTVTSIVAPAGSVTETIMLAYSPVAAVAPPPGQSFADLAFDLSAYRDGVLQTGFQFVTPITVAICYPDSLVVGIYEEALVLMQWVEQTAQWQDATTSCTPPSSWLREPDDNRLSVPICHLSLFALFKPQYQVYLPIVLRNR